MTITDAEAAELLAQATPGPWKQGRTPKVSREEQRAHLDSGTCECHDSWDQCPCAECGHFTGCDCCPLGTGLCGPRMMPWVDASAMCFIDVDSELSDDGNGGINDARLIAAAPDLAATVVELSAHRDRLVEDLTLANSVIAELEAERSALCATATAGILACEKLAALREAIDKVLALPLMNHKTKCKHCGHFTDTFAADTEAIRVALTQGGEGP